MLWLCNGSQYAYASSSYIFDKGLNLHQALNMSGFWIWHDYEYARVTYGSNMISHLQIIPYIKLRLDWNLCPTKIESCGQVNKTKLNVSGRVSLKKCHRPRGKHGKYCTLRRGEMLASKENLIFSFMIWSCRLIILVVDNLYIANKGKGSGSITIS